MDQTLILACNTCHHSFNFVLTEQQFIDLRRGVNPRDIISPVFSDHLLMFTTGVCFECWNVMELDYSQ